MNEIINRNGFEITVKNRIVKWMQKAERAGKLDDSLYEITRRVEEYGCVSTYKPKKRFCYPAILSRK